MFLVAPPPTSSDVTLIALAIVAGLMGAGGIGVAIVSAIRERNASKARLQELDMTHGHTESVEVRRVLLDRVKDLEVQSKEQQRQNIECERRNLECERRGEALAERCESMGESLAHALERNRQQQKDLDDAKADVEQLQRHVRSINTAARHGDARPSVPVPPRVRQAIKEKP